MIQSIHCLAAKMTGDMTVWELLWWTGGSDYPRQWWHGFGPCAVIFLFVFFSLAIPWYLFRRLTRGR